MRTHLRNNSFKVHTRGAETIHQHTPHGLMSSHWFNILFLHACADAGTDFICWSMLDCPSLRIPAVHQYGLNGNLGATFYVGCPSWCNLSQNKKLETQFLAREGASLRCKHQFARQREQRLLILQHYDHLNLQLVSTIYRPSPVWRT